MMTPTPTPDNQTPSIYATTIGEYINRHSCSRQLKLAFDDQALARAVPFFGETRSSLDIVLSASGHAHEERWEKALQVASAQRLTVEIADPTARDKATPWNAFAVALRDVEVGRMAYGREVSISGSIGAFHVSGAMDFVVLHWDNARPFLTIVECKASRKDRTYHRIQAATYRILLRSLLQRSPLAIGGVGVALDDIAAGVVRIDAERNAPQDIVAMRGMDLSFEEADVQRLLSTDGPMWRIYHSSLEEAEYQIDQKCDDCLFSVHCLPESARQRRLELVGCSPNTTRSLRAAGVATIDDLAELDLAGSTAAVLRANPDISENLEDLRRRAMARRKTLPDGPTRDGEYAVARRTGGPLSQLPSLVEADTPFVQVFLEVTYDHVADRVAALAAHVTASPHRIHTAFVNSAPDGQAPIWQPDPVVQEQILPRVETVVDPDNNAARVTYAPDPDVEAPLPTRPLAASEVIRIKSTAWTDRYDADTAAEAELIEGFFRELSDMINDVAGTAAARLHFYVWSRSQIKHLVDACRRGGSSLLTHLYELLGCRQNIDQLIYSSLQEEVDGRYALGWTGRGLSLVSSLAWYGRRYHWKRVVRGDPVDLDRAFRQDLFDFAVPIYHDARGVWVGKAEAEERIAAAKAAGQPPDVTTDVFEARARFHDDVPPAYLRAYWDSLGELHADPARVASYAQAARSSFLREFYRSRVLALRWIENAIGEAGRNDEIVKPPLDLARLTQFRLGGTGPASAAIDFMRLEQAVSLAEWIAAHMSPPGDRLRSGKTIPVREVRTIGRDRVRALIDVGRYGVSQSDLADTCSLELDDFVRISPCADEPGPPQTYAQITRGAMTGRIVALDWDEGYVEMSVIFQEESPYGLAGTGAAGPGGAELRFVSATIDDSPSDMIAPRVEKRLRGNLGTHAFRWFDPVQPDIPPLPPASADEEARARLFLSTLRTSAQEVRYGLGIDQLETAMAWQEARVLLIQGPPGTGKTQTTASAVLQRAYALSGGGVIVVAANTHRAVDELVDRISLLRPDAQRVAAVVGYAAQPTTLLRAHSSDPPPDTDDIIAIDAAAPVRKLQVAMRNGVTIIAGTTGALLKMTWYYNKSKTGQAVPGGFQADALVVDEASMMITPHFLALASLVHPDGRILASGDHRQLRSVLKHDWDHEDRPPIVLYEPHESAYRTIRAIGRRADLPPRTVREVGLSRTHRLHADVRALVHRVYADDGIVLTGRPSAAGPSLPALVGPEAAGTVWRGDAGVYLVVHAESKSTNNNGLEARIIADMLDRVPSDAAQSVAVVTPYRSQRVVLRRLLAERGHYGRPGSHVDVIDSVERLQGSERSVVFVSTATSDPHAVAARASFILNLNRANVAFTRSRDTLVVVCSRAMLDHIPVSFDDYETATLWKALRSQCTRPVGRFAFDDVPVVVMAPPITLPSTAGEPVAIAGR